MVGWSAPAPKDPPEAKSSDQEEAEAVTNPLTVERNRSVSNGHLKQLAIAIHSYNDAFGVLPQNIVGKDGKPLLSWRVQLLPFIEETALSQQFKMDEPWNSKHNLELLESMPKIFTNPRVSLKKKGYTVYQVFEGKGTLFENGVKQKLTDVTDGLSNTILLTESSIAVPWTKPIDMSLNAKKELPDFGKAYGMKPLAAVGDGAVRTLDLKKIKPETIKAAITPAGGEVLGKDWEP
jgi:hypothetical protein